VKEDGTLDTNPVILSSRRSKMFKALVIAVVALSLSALPVLGDVVHLQDGRVIEGRIATVTDNAILVQLEGDESPALMMEIPKAQVVYAAYVVNEQSLARAGEALIRARTLYFIGLGLGVLGGLVTFFGGQAGALIGPLMSIAGTLASLIAIWNIGTAGEHLIQASR